MLLAWAKVEGKRVIRRGCGQKNTWDFVTQCGPGMCLIAMMCGPHAPATQTSRPSVFSSYFKGFKRFPTLATSLMFDCTAVASCIVSPTGGGERARMPHADR